MTQPSRGQRFLKGLIQSLIGSTHLYLFAAVLITALSLWAATHLKIDSDYMAFLPEDFPGVASLKQVIQKTGGFGNFMVILEGADPATRRRYAEDFAKKAQSFDWVDYTEFKKDVGRIDKSRFLLLGLEDLQEMKARVEHFISFKKNPMTISLFEDHEPNPAILDFSDIQKKYQSTALGSDYFEDPAQKFTIAVIWPKGSMTHIEFSKKAYADLLGLVDSMNSRAYHQDLKVAIGGEIRSKIDEYEALLRNVAGSSLATLGLISLFLYLFFRRWGSVFYTLIPLLMGTVWCSGLAAVLVGRLNLLTVFLIAILFGIGIDYGIYMLSRYTEERVAGRSLEDALKIVVGETGKVVFSAAWTTALAFATLCFTDFKGFFEFGLLASLGILVLFAAFWIYSPLVWIYAERLGLFHPELPKKILWLPKMPHGRGIALWGVLLGVGCLWFVPQVEFEYDYSNLRSKTNSYYTLDPKIYQVFQISRTPGVILADTLEDATQITKDLRSRLPQLTTVDAIKSITDFIPQEVEPKKQVLAEVREMIEKNIPFLSPPEKQKLDEILPYLNPPDLSMQDLPKTLLRQFVGLEGFPGYMVFIYNKVKLSDARNALKYAEEVKKINVGNKTYYTAEGSLLFAETLDLMKREALTVFIFMMIVVLGNLWFDFKKLSTALLVFAPMILGLCFTFGVMVLMGLKFNIFNLIIFPILIGMGDDGNLLLYDRLKDANPQIPFYQRIQTAGTPVLLAGFTTMMGFGSLLSAEHLGLKSLGVLAIVGIVCLQVACLVFFPAFIRWVRH